ncbi:MAG: VOC family protein [Microbacterium gubbeenense]
MMAIKQAPYLAFHGEAGDALAFYQQVLGGTLDITRYKDMPMDDMPGDPEWVMHGQVELDNGITIMAADSPGEHSGSAIVQIILYGDDRVELEGLHDAMGAGGTVEMPFEAAPWGGWFGQVKDRFGVTWMFEGGGEQAA